MNIVMPVTFPVTCHTNFVGHGSMFVAIEGYADNGINYIRKAIEKGAQTLVLNNNVKLDSALHDFITTHNVHITNVENTRKELAYLSAQAAQFPAKKLKIIGITGTKGKTTTAFILAHCLQVAGHATALISSAGNTISDSVFTSPLTTPQPDYLHQFLRLCVDNGIEYVVMEVAAQALTLYRVQGIHFDGIIFTNFSHEHLEFYATLDDYYAAKCQIFDMAKENAPIIINKDDERVKLVQDNYAHLTIKTYSIVDDTADFYGIYKNHEQSTVIQMGIDSFVCPTLFGYYNGYNILAAMSMAFNIGIEKEKAAYAIATFAGVPGRLQRINLPNGSCAFIDYAHNPSSFYAVLSTLRILTKHLIVIFGAGGGKDTLKRPIMGNIAAQFADIIILTSDNPRLEDPQDIINDIHSGITQDYTYKVIECIDRQKAIKKAYAYSTKGSIIAILGKGSDEYQIIGTTKYYFSEQIIFQQLL